LRLRGCAGARTLLLVERGRHGGEVEDGVHLCVRQYGHAVPARAHVGAVVVWSVVVVAARDDLAALTAPSVKDIGLFAAASAHCER